MFNELLDMPKAKTLQGASVGKVKKQVLCKELWIKCSRCGEVFYTKDLEEEFMICSKCNKHFRIGAKDRIKMVADEGSFCELDSEIITKDPLNFPSYKDKIDELRNINNINDAVVTGICSIGGIRTVLCVMDSYFMMGSMGTAVGEKITRAIERATEHTLPIIIFSASGGARMQEGIFSLMQMIKISAAITKHDEAGLLYITVLTDPTVGGVLASFAMQGDIILAEPDTLVGFTGKRVIKQTINQVLPEGFQTSEFLHKHGFIDRIVYRKEMKATLLLLLEAHGRRE